MPSSIPGAVSNLFSLLTTAFASETNVQVYRGGALTTYVAPITVQILGWQGTQKPAELGPSYRREETFAIQMEIAAYEGDLAFATVETNVMNAFGIVSVTVANNWTLPSTAGGNDGTVRFSEVSTFTYKSSFDGSGQAAGILTFDVNCQQRIQSLV